MAGKHGSKPHGSKPHGSKPHAAPAPFGMVVTIPMPRIKGLFCTERHCWPWENILCRRRAALGCESCEWAKEVVVVSGSS